MSVATKTEATPTLEVRVYWHDADGQGHEARVSLESLVKKLAEIAGERGKLVSISRANPRT